MKALIRSFAALLAASLAAGLGMVGATSAQQADAAPQEQVKAQDDTPTAAPAQACEAGAEVESAVQESADDATAERRKKLVEEAVEALDETHAALEALERHDSEAALDSLALATGKLALIVARSPELALAPVDVRLVTYDLYATVEAVEEASERARQHLANGRVQDARRLLSGLRSDLVIEVVNLPLATYPAAIRAITPLIDDDRIEDAKVSLQQALNTLVVTQYVRPLPILRVEHLLERAKELAETAERTEQQTEELDRLLADARQQLELAEVLGYGEQDDFDGFYGQLDEIAQKTSGGKFGQGFFDAIESALRAFGKSAPEETGT